MEIQCGLDNYEFLTVYYIVVNAKVSAHLYEHIHTNISKYTCMHAHSYVLKCSEEYINDQDTCGYQIIYSVLTCQVCILSITCRHNLYHEKQ